MEIVLWVLQGLLAAVMGMAGLAKLTQGRDKLLATQPRMAWVEDFSPAQVRAIGALELLAGIGLVLPWLLGIAPVLTPLAGLGVLAIMAGAALTHARRGEREAIIGNVIIGLIALVVALGRFATL